MTAGVGLVGVGPLGLGLGLPAGLELRPPREPEWPILRMLLPETFAESGRREYRLALRKEAPRVVGAVSFQRLDGGLKGLRVHVAAAFRRRGIGSWILRSVGRDGGVLEGVADLRKDCGAREFAERNGFQRVDGLTTVETDLAPMREYLHRLRGRFALPEGARLVLLPEASFAEVAQLHADHVAASGGLDRWRGVIAGAKGFERSPVLVRDGRVVAMLLWGMEKTGAHVQSLVVAPEFRDGRLNAPLLAAASDLIWEHGGRRVRFEYNDATAFTRRLGERFGAEVVAELAMYRRDSC